MALIGLKQKAKIILCKVICLIQTLPHTGNTNTCTPMRPILTLGNNETD